MTTDAHTGWERPPHVLYLAQWQLKYLASIGDFGDSQEKVLEYMKLFYDDVVVIGPLPPTPKAGSIASPPTQEN